MKFLLITLFSFFALARTPVAQPQPFDTTKLSEKGREAYEAIRNARVYSLGGVGYSGAMSREERALVVLVAEPEAKAALRVLTEESSELEGKLLALTGLRCVDRTLFADQLKVIRALPGPSFLPEAKGKPLVEFAAIMVEQGCKGPRPESCRAMLRRIETGGYSMPCSRKLP